MGANKNSIQEFGYEPYFTRAPPQAATEVPLDLGARPNQQPHNTRSGNTHNMVAKT
jgi:hypothetical protein